MCAVLVVVANILREPAFQVAFVNCNDVIQEITPATPYPTLCDSILPRTFERSAERIHPQGSNRCGDFQSILGITIKDGMARSYNKTVAGGGYVIDFKVGQSFGEPRDASTHTFGTIVALRPDQLDMAKVGRLMNRMRLK
jgi:hypothetical protein